MKIFTSADIRRIDELTAKQENVTTLDMIERAGSAVAYEIMSRWRQSQRIVIFAGPGNNGADALVTARLLYEQGYAPEVYLFNIKSSHLSQGCSVNRQRLTELEGVNYTEIVTTFNPPAIDGGDVVVDGLFGSGLRKPLVGGYTALVQYINDSGAYVVSIDIPSGLFGEWNTGTDRRNIVRANLTLTFQFKRLSFFFQENAPYIGECKVLDMEASQEAINTTPTDFYMVEAQDIHDILHRRDPFMNKYDNGSLLLVCGSYGMMGAAVLASRAAMRAGSGLVTVHAPRCGYSIMQTAVPEALFEPDANEIFTTSVEMRHGYSVVALGPGISTASETVDAIDMFLKRFNLPCLLDADALNCIAQRPILLRSIPKRSVITPHTVEFDRLFGHHDTDEERLKKAIDVSRTYEISIVLKGHYTMVVRPDKKVYVNSSGNAGMATAGSGDVLTGIIASLIGQGYKPDQAVVMGVYIHGYAGDLAAQKMGQYGMVASDIVDNIGIAIRDLMK